MRSRGEVLRCSGPVGAGCGAFGAEFGHDQPRRQQFGSRTRWRAAAVRVNSQPARAVAGLAQAAHALDPAEALLDPLADALTVAWPGWCGADPSGGQACQRGGTLGGAGGLVTKASSTIRSLRFSIERWPMWQSLQLLRRDRWPPDL